MTAVGAIAGLSFAILVVAPRGFATPGVAGIQLHQTGFCLAGVVGASLWALRQQSLACDRWAGRLILSVVVSTAVSAVSAGTVLANPVWSLYPIAMLVLPYMLAESATRGQGLREFLFVVQLTAVALALMAIGEHIVQGKLFGSRSFYDARGDNYTLNLSRNWNEAGISNLPLSSIGPFASNLPFAGVVCSLGGLLVGMRRSAWAAGLASLAVGCAIQAVQSRAGLVSLLVLIGAFMAADKGRARSLAAASGVSLSFVIAMCNAGYARWSIVFANNVYSFEHVISVILCCVVFGACLWIAARRLSGVVFGVLAAGFCAITLAVSLVMGVGDDAGGLTGRAYGVSVLARNMLLSPWGTGPGSLFNHDEGSGIEIFSDQGSLLTFAGELGVLAGVCLAILLLRSIHLSACSSNRITVAAGLGVVAAVPGVLSSVSPEPWIVIVALTCIVEATASRTIPWQGRSGLNSPTLVRSAA